MTKLQFIQSQFPKGRQSGNMVKDIVCPDCKNKSLAYYMTENHPYGCKACGITGNVYTLGFKNIEQSAGVDGFKKTLDMFHSHHNGKNKHRLSSRVLDIFDIRYKEIRTAKGKTFPAVGIWNKDEPEKWLVLDRDSQKYRWLAPSAAVYGARKNPFLFDSLIDKTLDTVYITAGEFDAFAFYELTDIIPLSTRNGESCRINNPKYAKIFANKKVVILFDNESVGRSGAAGLAADIDRFEKAKIQIIDMSKLVQRGGEDLDDYANKYNGTKERLFSVINDTPIFTPPENVQRKILNNPDLYSNLDSDVQHAIKQDYDIRYNVIKNMIEYKKKDCENYKRIDDRKINDILLSVRQYDELRKLSKSRFNENFYSSFMPDYNPFKAFCESLPQYDGQDHIAELLKYISVNKYCKDYQYTDFKYWIVGCIAQMFPLDEFNIFKKTRQRGKNQYCLIFQGEQQKRKTDFFEHLTSVIGHDYFYSGDIDPKNKDHQISVAENAIIHLDELSDKIRYHKTLEQYKSLVAGAQTINVRKPYDREHMTVKRHASFCASINDAQGLLDDLTGARRWLVWTGVEIDDKIYDFDLKKLWAQAFDLYLSGFIHWYEDPDILNKRNERYRRQRTEEELFYRAVHDGKLIAGKYSAADILVLLNEEYQIKNLNSVNIGKILNKLFVSKRIRGVRKYIIEAAEIAKINEQYETVSLFSDDEIF